MSGALLGVVFLALPALGADGELAVERSRDALAVGRADLARELAIEALARERSGPAWTLYLRASQAVGLAPAARAEVAALEVADPELHVARVALAVRNEELPLDALKEVAEAVPDPGRIALAAELWAREAKPGVLAIAPDEPDDPLVARLRLQVTSSTGEARLGAVLAHAWLRDHPDQPQVLAALWESPTEIPQQLRTRRKVLARLRKQIPEATAVELLRAAAVFAAADATADLERIDAGLAALGVNHPEPAHAQRFADAMADADARRRVEDYDGAVDVFVALRAVSDGPDAAIEHARLLQVLERYPEALEVGLEALSAAAGPTPDDLGCLDTAAHAARMADAMGLIAEVSLALARTRTAREAATAAHALDPHPRWTALLAQAEVLPDNPDDPGLAIPPRVQAVVDTLVDATDAEAWVARAGAHEAAGERHAAFVAWVIAGAQRAPVGDAVKRTWDGPGDPEEAAAGALEAFHAARRSHREAMAGLRSDGIAGAPIAHAFVAPGPGLMLPEWEAVGVDGQQIGSATLRGRPYVLSVWASWCTPCLLELPDLNTRASQLARPVTAVAISVDERETVFKRRAADGGWTELVLGWNPDLGAVLGVDGLPTNFAIDAEGRIVHVERGYSPEGVERLIARAQSLP